MHSRTVAYALGEHGLLDTDFAGTSLEAMRPVSAELIAGANGMRKPRRASSAASALMKTPEQSAKSPESSAAL